MFYSDEVYCSKPSLRRDQWPSRSLQGRHNLLVTISYVPGTIARTIRKLIKSKVSELQGSCPSSGLFANFMASIKTSSYSEIFAGIFASSIIAGNISFSFPLVAHAHTTGHKPIMISGQTSGGLSYGLDSHDSHPPDASHTIKVRERFPAPHRRGPGTNEETRRWLEKFHSSASSGSTRTSTPIAPEDPSELEEYFRSYLRSRLPTPQIQLVTERKHKKPSGRQSFDFSFTLRDLPIIDYRVKAHRQASGRVIIIGEIPGGEYDSAFFNQGQSVNDFSDDALLQKVKLWLNSRESTSPSRDLHDSTTYALAMINNDPCVITEEGMLVPARCLSLRRSYSFLSAYITAHGVVSVQYNTAHLCGSLQNIHILNEQSAQQNFKVDLCDTNSTRRHLANSRFIFEGINTCSEITEHPALPPFDEGPLRAINTEETSLSTLSSHNGIFQYTGKNTPGYRMMHVFSHLNRMMDWFNFHGFEMPDHHIIRLFVRERGENNAHYTRARGVSGSIHVISFGPDDPNKLSNLATDFDVGAHELAHYVIDQSLHVSRDLEDGNLRGTALTNHFITLSIHEGLADYFTYAATNNDCLGESVDPTRNCLRTAMPIMATEWGPSGEASESDTTSFKYGDEHYLKLLHNTDPDTGDRSVYYHKLGQMVSGFFWAPRQKLTTPERRAYFDAMVLNSLDFITASSFHKSHISYADLIEAAFESDLEFDRLSFCSLLWQNAQEIFADLPRLSEVETSFVTHPDLSCHELGQELGHELTSATVTSHLALPLPPHNHAQEDPTKKNPIITDQNSYFTSKTRDDRSDDSPPSSHRDNSRETPIDIYSITEAAAPSCQKQSFLASQLDLYAGHGNGSAHHPSRDGSIGGCSNLIARSDILHRNHPPSTEHTGDDVMIAQGYHGPGRTPPSSPSASSYSQHSHQPPTEPRHLNLTWFLLWAALPMTIIRLLPMTTGPAGRQAPGTGKPRKQEARRPGT